ncbi:MAG TPA: phosphoadenylyl-sulfate reductase [Lacibacter sp.]|nr:phosphoadenylyl-sulfate reductase [Lacibacter sp.]HMO87770.1 phosphoadenylyl-sulfate reductase [Lacibacter sp.]HMP85698.1 phosphoadenylyl-sulfate reductase [Lacibacter sp.]
MELQTQIPLLEQQLAGCSPEEALRQLADAFPGTLVFSTSFGLEDQAITHMICSQQLEVELFTLDTGRLYTDTYSTWRQTIETFGCRIHAYYPDAAALQGFVSEKGPNAFYESVTNRQECCRIRKVEPLQRALRGRQVWITGLRAEQSPNRQGMQQLEWDVANGIIKYHPLLQWTWEELNRYIREHQVPYNALHDKGFVSIGCAPCTRAIRPGEDFRAGRWWWEDGSRKECGLHLHPDTSS